MSTDALLRDAYIRTLTAVRSAPRHLDAITRRPARGLRLGAWWIGATGVGLIALAGVSPVVVRVGAARSLLAGSVLVFLAVLAYGVAGSARTRVRPGMALLAGAGVPLLLVGGAQLAVPAVMEGRMRSGLAAMGDVYSVDIGSFPAVKMLWGGADRAELHLGELDASRRREGGNGLLGGDVLEQLQEMDSLEVTVARLKAGPISAEDVKVTKRDDALRGQATVVPDELAKAMGAGQQGIELKPKVVDGELRLTMSGEQLGGQKLTVRVYAEDGQIMSKLDVDSATAEALGMPPGQEPPAQPMFPNDKVSVDSLKVRESGDRLVIDAGGRLAGDEPVA